MTDKITLGQILASAPASNKAITAPDRPDLSYGELASFVERTGGQLRAAGVGRDDKVAIVLPNGPEMAVSFLATANAAVAAPLNPNYKKDEFSFYMDDLSASLLICDDAAGAAAQAAKGLGIQIAVISVDAAAPAGTFTMDIEGDGICPLDESRPDDPCLVLHTSGTTSRPKIVPLSQLNVATSGQNIARTLGLVSSDICMNIMPLFHIHGLIAAVSSTMAAGAEIYCTPGFNALKVFSWLEDCRPSWYTAVPTMHQAILGRAARNEEIVKNMKLRFIRSSSSSLPPTVMAELEEVFGCPVVEAYGMTEATHQMASNPIGKGTQKPGAVGIAAGPKVAIHDGTGLTTEPDVIGEICISGANVTAGYESNEKANAENFFMDGDERWFRTGDQGRMDSDGYIYITGRLKEIINRGGEKISPREVDEVLMEHPAVNQAVTFAVKHPQLGEDVGAAVVLNEGASAEAKDIRAFAGEKLAGFKVPRQVLILDEIPKGATGKLQRIGLAKVLGLED
ncbi:acyl--CoA ligase [Alisedimentitalea sp. MJ-SS2]|uniref:acyl--CoA ligase n=1 Tax=Aliisedimentitalea sp. MJ-SS2 TaxID=3049795 RepID=UPI00290C5BA0|nr:acyl--CoA ligase [Alisedimentitalea sp. MJ-SS2]MDU8928105.1 acyl--CoA ligase [Alisedimentitalea sp. MJ-SS2]